MTKKKPLSTRAKARLARIRRDPFGRLTLAIRAYLESRGWSVLVVGPARVQHEPTARKMTYEFVVDFTGVKKTDRS